MVIQSRTRQTSKSSGNSVQEESDEFINVNVHEKRDGEEEELLVPFLLDSMFDNSSPTAVHDFPNETSPGKSNCLDIPVHLRVPFLCEDEDTPEVDVDTLQRPPSLSPQSVTTAVDKDSAHPFSFPPDIRYEGEVIFQNSPLKKNINLLPRSLEDNESIFSRGAYPQKTERLHFLNSEGDSFSYTTCGEREDCEELKDEEEAMLNPNEELTYINGNRCSEDAYWNSLNSPSVIQGIGKEGIARHHSTLFAPYERKPTKESKLEMLIRSFMDIFACGEYGKPYASRPIVSTSSANSLHAEQCLTCGKDETFVE